MKTQFKFLLLSIVLMFLAVGNVSAITYTFEDNYANWPNQTTDSRDVIGTPLVGDMRVTVNDLTGHLETVEIDVEYRRSFDTLFINDNYVWNTGDDKFNSDYETWNYLVYDEFDDFTVNDEQPLPSGLNAGLYLVKNENNYDYLISPEGRTGHPDGIEEDDLQVLFPDKNWISYTDSNSDGKNDKLIYDFTSSSLTGPGILVGNQFVIGYTPWCANDVQIGTPVPEPATLVLLGFGLLGIAGITRRKLS